jgi:hypothetical protein
MESLSFLSTSDEEGQQLKRARTCSRTSEPGTETNLQVDSDSDSDLDWERLTIFDGLKFFANWDDSDDESEEGCYSPYSFASHLSVLVLTPYSSSVGTTLLRLVSLHVPRRVHFLFPFPFVTDLTPFSELPTGRGLICSSLLTFLADASCPISRTLLSPKPILSYRLVFRYYSYDSMVFLTVLRLRVAMYLRNHLCTLVFTFDLRNLAYFIVQDRSS